MSLVQVQPGPFIKNKIMLSDILHFIEKQNRMNKVAMALATMMIFVLYSLIGIVYKNYKINDQIENLRQEIAYLQENNLEQKNRILYYSTDTYAEKVLREKLGYQKEGERVYALTRKDPEKERLAKEQKRYQEREDGKSNIIRWWDYFFKK
ncbi:septum formation initiator family protein [Candidatus Microgenomates bacterium]|nr:septum formation initiator family protein [Candidatus Microgenomates bacterium]